jgi:DNA-binding NarL/FixJ family response regulator
MPAPESFPLSLPQGGGLHSSLPLQGLTLLAVEDSRFASEALRLLCQRSGARLRRAETLAAARRHLTVYRPDVVIVDFGLPDGDGGDLIRALAALRAPGLLILGTSGDPARRAEAMAAGAQGFLDKPPESLAAFQRAILAHFPGAAVGPDAAMPAPDPIALQDDLSRAAALLATRPDAAGQRYITGFLGGIARSAHDAALAQAAGRAAAAPQDLHRLAALVRARLDDAPGPFVAPPG